MSTETTEKSPPSVPLPSDGVSRSRGLDGLRALAVAAVVAYHVHPAWVPGGFLGVDLFFVISGYLITSLLAAEKRRTGRLRLASFWARRARRLLPAMWAVLMVAACAATLLGGDTYAGLRGTVTAALTYSSNWWQIARHDTYFAGVGGKPVLQHLWSLAVEEQFYVLWPLLLTAAMTVLRRRRHQAAFAAALSVVCFVLMGALYTPDTDTSRVYYGTDTHGGGLLLGAAAALVLPLATASGADRADRIRALDLLGLGGLVVLVVAAEALDGTGAAVYRGGLAVACLGAVAVTLAASAPGRFGRALSSGPLVWVGRRSYGIYLWHWPVIAVLSDSAPDFAGSAAGRCAMLGLSVGAAAVSYRVLEEPLIRLGIRGYLATARRWFLTRAETAPKQALALAAGAVGVVTVAGIGVTHAPATTGLEAQIAAGERLAGTAGATPKGISGDAVASGDTEISGRTAASGDTTRTGGAPQPVIGAVPPVVAGPAPLFGGPQPVIGAPPPVVAGPAPVPRGPQPLIGAAPPLVAGTDAPAPAAAGPAGTRAPARPSEGVRAGRVADGAGMTAVGDSVMLASADALRRDFPGIAVEARVGRQMNAAPDILRALSAGGQLRRVVVIGLGTNGGFTDAVIDDVLRVAGPSRTVAFINVHVPQPWESAVNAALDRAARRHPGTVVVDWNTAISHDPQRLWTDHTHPRPSGTGIYADAIRDALNASRTSP